MGKKARAAKAGSSTAIQATLDPSRGDLPETIAAGLTLVLVYAVLLSRFDLSLLFTDTILTGGDTASWYQVLRTLKTDFLPHGRLFGFSQSNFFGYLEGQHYFVLPFLSAALLGFLVPLTIALKLATVAGGFALPLTMFIAASSIAGKKRAGALASALSLLFLFNESYSIFGGNWLSTFAGEFSFSWGIALLPLFIASVFDDARVANGLSGDRPKGGSARGGNRGIRSGILLGLIGLCHFFVFMPAFFLPFFPAFGLAPQLFRKSRGGGGTKRGADSARQGQTLAASETTLRVIITYLMAFLTMAFWLLPMATTRAWAQPISMIWRFASLKDFARQTQAWIWAPLAAIFLVIACARRVEGRLRAFMAFALYALAACAFLFYAAPGLGMPDIRFIPTALLVCALGLAIIADHLLARLGMREPSGKATTARKVTLFAIDTALPSAASFLLAAVLCAAVPFMARNAPSWFRWNYSGYEARTEWPAMRELGERYRGTVDDGRFLWEKQDQRDNKDFGSERGFENLSLFTGHPTSEGIHYGSSMMARAATYLQSSYSQNPVDPEAERIYSVIDPPSWPARFSLLNARYIVAHSETIADLFAAQPGFALDAKIGKFSVFAYAGYPGHYVQALPADSISIVDEGAGGFKPDYYRFFREYELYPYPFVASEFADASIKAIAKKSGGIWRGYDEYRNVYLAKAALAAAAPDGVSARTTTAIKAVAEPSRASPAPGVISNEHVDNFRIAFDTSAPGTPHYVKVSYAPGWRSRGGERIYPVSPGFMLIFPTSSHVELVYGRTVWEIMGILFTLLALPLAFIFYRVRPGKDFPWKLLVGIAFAIFAAAAVFLVLQTSAGYPALAKDIEAARRLDLSVGEQREKALALVEPWATKDNLERFDNRLAFDAYRIKALALLRQKKGAEAKAAIDVLRARYPHTRALESLPTLAP